MNGLITWWNERSPREHMLLIFMAALFAMIFAVYGVARPILAARAAADSRLASAMLADQAVSRQIADLRSTSSQAPATASATPLAQLVEQSASDAGFQPGTAETQGEGRVVLTIPAARARPLFGWLSLLEKQGVFVEQAQISTKSDGALTATLTLRRRAS